MGVGWRRVCFDGRVVSRLMRLGDCVYDIRGRVVKSVRAMGVHARFYTCKLHRRKRMD